MSKHSGLAASLSRRARESARRRRDRDLKVESLEPRLALATGLLSTLVSIRDESGQKLLAPGATAEIAEGEQLTASVRLTRRPDSGITVSFKSLAPLEVAAPPTTLRFTKANWNQPQTVSFGSHQDNVRDGDHRVPVKVITAVARNPQRQAARKVWIDSLDSGVVAAGTPATATYRGSIVGGKSTGSVFGSYDSVTNRGTATFTVTMPTLKNVRNRVITAHYSVGADNRVQIESLAGITASTFRWDATYRELGNDRGLFGTVTVLQPQAGMSATATMTAAAVPEAVQNLAVAPTGVGSLLLSWNPPAGGATGYAVTMTATTTSYVNGTPTTTTNTTTSTTTATSMPFTGLSGTNVCTFAVVANNAAGGGAASTVSFGPQTVTVGALPIAFTKGLDGSIWVLSAVTESTSAGSAAGTVQQVVNVNGTWTAQPAISVGLSPSDLTTGLDGSIWVANKRSNTVQQITNRNGVWTVQPAIGVGLSPAALTAGRDGSIWVTNYGVSSPPASGTVQQIVNQNGVWTAQPAIDVGNSPLGITTGLDGSIWVANKGSNTVQQITNSNGAWTVQPAIGVGVSPAALTTGLDGSIWVTNYGVSSQPASGTVQQIVNQNGVWTALPAIDVGNSPLGITTGLDGSIWLAHSASNTVQQIVNTYDGWMAQTALSANGSAITTDFVHTTDVVVADDGSIWFAQPYRQGTPFFVPVIVPGVPGGGYWTTPKVPNTTVPQLVDAPSLPINLSAASGPGEMTLSWTAPSGNGAAIVSYTVSASQGTTSQTITTSSTSYTFSGLTSGQGTTYFTVTATNFGGTSPVAALLLGPNGTPLSTTNTSFGIVTDGTPFSGGGFDGNGNAYSWEALGSSPTLAWNGVTFDLGSPNQPDAMVANGQTIPVPQGNYTTLNLAGAAVNGSQTSLSQQFTLTFTDNSTVMWQQSFSDWTSPQNYAHEAIISTQSYRDTASGGTNQTTNHIYGYSYTIPAGKTLASITLPKNQNVRLFDVQLSTATSVDLSSAYTSWGIANGNTQVANHQGFDGGGFYYYSGNLQSTIAWSGATFAFGPVPNSKNGQNNFVQAKGQSINLPQGDYGWLYLAGAGANGNQQNQVLTLTFSDGSTATWTQSFSDWCGPQNYAGETIIQMQYHRVNQVGNLNYKPNYVYGYAYQIPAGKTLASVKLPNNTNNLGILGIAMM